jgi:hypothetical protein
MVTLKTTLIIAGVTLILGGIIGVLLCREFRKPCPEVKEDPSAAFHEALANDLKAKCDSLIAENDRIISATKPTPKRVNDATKALTDMPLITGFDTAVKIHGADIKDVSK